MPFNHFDRPRIHAAIDALIQKLPPRDPRHARLERFYRIAEGLRSEVGVLEESFLALHGFQSRTSTESTQQKEKECDDY